MAQTVSPHSEMAYARQSDCINVIFDERSPAGSSSRSSSRRSSSSNSSRLSSRRSRGRGAYKGRYRSSSSSSSSTSRSTSRSSRSRSHPRCHRHSSRCRCSNHHRRNQRGRSRHSPHRRYRAHSGSHSRSPSVDRYYHRRRYRSRSRSSSYRSRYSYSRVGRYRCQFSRSPPRSFRGRPRSRSLERSIALSLEEKRQLLEVARQNAMKNLGVQKLEIPESVKPILMLPSAVSERGFAEPETRVRRDSENTSQRSTEVENDAQSPRLSPKQGITFSSNNSVAKPTVSTQPCAKVTSLVDSVESKKPYGHWIPVKSAHH